MAVLGLEKSNQPLKSALERLVHAICGEEIQRIATANWLSPRDIVREPPIDDAQTMFFVPSLHDAPIKDDFNLMDIPQASSKRSAITLG